MTPSWTRPDDLRSRSRRWTPTIVGAIALGLAVTVGMLAAGEPAQLTTVVPVPVVAPVHVTTPATPAPVVHVNVPPPPQPVVAAEPEPKYRPVAPILDPECIGERPETPMQACSWDTGFPAISADGSLMVDAYVPDDGGRGWPGLTIHIIHVATSKIVRSMLILSPNEHDPQGAITDKLRAKIKRRTAAAQRVIDVHRFHSLVRLGDRSAGSDVDRKQIHAEFDGNAMRLLDPATQTVLWRHRFEAPAPPGMTAKPDGECDAWNFAAVDVSWDPTSRTVFANLLYHHGGCLCGSSAIAQVFRIGR